MEYYALQERRHADEPDALHTLAHVLSLGGDAHPALVCWMGEHTSWVYWPQLADFRAISTGDLEPAGERRWPRVLTRMDRSSLSPAAVIGAASQVARIAEQYVREVER